MASNVIASDYESVKSTVNKMEQNLNDILAEVKKYVAAIENTRNWQGPDAVKYKTELLNYASKIVNSCEWLENLNNIIVSHSQELYERSLNDSKKS